MQILFLSHHIKWKWIKKEDVEKTNKQTFFSSLFAIIEYFASFVWCFQLTLFTFRFFSNLNIFFSFFSVFCVQNLCEDVCLKICLSLEALLAFIMNFILGFWMWIISLTFWGFNFFFFLLFNSLTLHHPTVRLVYVQEQGKSLAKNDFSCWYQQKTIPLHNLIMRKRFLIILINFWMLLDREWERYNEPSLMRIQTPREFTIKISSLFKRYNKTSWVCSTDMKLRIQFWEKT